MSREAVIIDNVRTGLANAHRVAINMTRPDDQIAGCGIPEGPQGMILARIATILAGLPTSVAATTVNRFCSPGSQAIMMAANQILQEGVDVAIGSGVETITMIQDG